MTTFPKIRWLCMASVFALLSCSRGPKLTDAMVSGLLDARDQAFSDGDIAGACDQVGEDFTYRENMINGSTPEPNTVEELEALRAEGDQQSFAGPMNGSGSPRALSRDDFCNPRHPEMDPKLGSHWRRLRLGIDREPDGSRADYHAEYVLVAETPEGYEPVSDADAEAMKSHLHVRLNESGTVAVENGRAVIESASATLITKWMDFDEIPEIDRPKD